MQNTILVSLLGLSVLVLLGVSQAEAKNSSRVILADSKTFVAEVSEKTVRCSELGYGSGLLKINLVGLDGWTLFDHTNSHVGEFGDPCMAAGACRVGDSTVAEFINKGGPGTEIVTVQRTVLEHKLETKDQNGQDVCMRSLQEDLSTSIRGEKFLHTRYGAEQIFSIEVCRR